MGGRVRPADLGQARLLLGSARLHLGTARLRSCGAQATPSHRSEALWASSPR